MSHLAELEVLLFVAGEDGLTVRELAELLHLQPSALVQQLEKLAEKMVEEHEQVEPQQPALSAEEPEFLAEDDPEFEEIEVEKSEPAAVKAVQKDESAAVTKKVTKKKS